MSTQVELSAKDLADSLGVSPRMINLYRASVEQRTGRSLGVKRGRTVYFSPEDQGLIASERHSSASAQQAQAQSARQSSHNSQHWQGQTQQAEAQTIGGMDGLLAVGDQNAIVMGQQLGQRWTGLMMTAAMQTMAEGMSQLTRGMEEVQASMFVSLSSPPVLPGSASSPPQLEPSDDEIDY